MSDEQTTPEVPEEADTAEVDATTEGTQDQPEWAPPTREEWDALQTKLKKSNEDAKRNRRLRTELEQQHETDAEKAAREAEESAAAKYKPLAVKSAAKAAFIEAGANTARFERLFKLLDLDRIEFDGDDMTGLAEQVDELKADVPELFTARRSPDEDDLDVKPKPPKVTAAGRRPAAQSLTPGDIVARQVFGSR